MDAFELNKIGGALVGALAIYLGVTFVVEGMFGGGYGHHEELAYSIALDDDVAEPVEAEPQLTIAELMAAADADRGARVFRRCTACHTIEAGGGNGVGPALHGVMGREIGSVGGYDYSDALAGMAGAAWDWDAMYGFLKDPKDWAPGTKMNFAGLDDGEDRANIMAYLNANTDAPIDLPVE